MYWHKNLSLGDITEEINGIIYIEEWRHIKESPDYLVSNFGRVKSSNRWFIHPIKGKVEVQEKILSQKVTTNGYCRVQISINRVKFKRLVHRLVGVEFLENPENKPEINHKKGNRSDNRASEIEWSTSQENNLHAYRVLNRKRPQSYLGKFGKLHHASKKVYCPTLYLTFESARIAGRELGVSQGSISHICNGSRTQVEGLVFKYL